MSAVVCRHGDAMAINKYLDVMRGLAKSITSDLSSLIVKSAIMISISLSKSIPIKPVQLPDDVCRPTVPSLELELRKLKINLKHFKQVE